MSYEEAINISNDLRTRFDAPFSNIDKSTIVELYGEVLGKQFHPTSCQQCYHDALIEIVLYLRKEKRMAEKCNYRLRAGYILNSPHFRCGKIYTNDNLTDEVAEEYLSMFPDNRSMFQALPENKTVGRKNTAGPKVPRYAKEKPLERKTERNKR